MAALISTSSRISVGTWFRALAVLLRPATVENLVVSLWVGFQAHKNTLDSSAFLNTAISRRLSVWWSCSAPDESFLWYFCFIHWSGLNGNFNIYSKVCFLSILLHVARLLSVLNIFGGADFPHVSVGLGASNGESRFYAFISPQFNPTSSPLS